MNKEKGCMICHGGLARHQCAECGSLVCEDHYDHRTNRCSSCAFGTAL